MSLVLGVADGWVVILSCLSDSIIHELMDERVNEPWLENQAQAELGWSAGLESGLAHIKSPGDPVNGLLRTDIYT